MDPAACYREMLEADDQDTERSRALDLIMWAARGGAGCTAHMLTVAERILITALDDLGSWEGETP